MGFCRSAIDLIGEQEVGEDWARQKLEAARGIAHHADAGHVGRHQVGGKLNPRELEAERARQRTHQKRLGRARHSLDEQMATGEKGDERILDRNILADDS